MMNALLPARLAGQTTRAGRLTSCAPAAAGLVWKERLAGKGCSMKKYTFALLLFMLFVLVSCDMIFMEPEAPAVNGGDDNGPYYKTFMLKPANNDVIGINTASSVRSLSKDNALMGYDFFEAVFVYNNGGSYITSRTSFDIDSFGAIDIYRTQAGINYSGVTGTPANGAGSAVMFVGKGGDKTLLGVGRLSHVDGAAMPAVINNQTKTVTFEIHALKAGVSRPASASSFRTYSNSGMTTENTVISPDTGSAAIYVHERTFPLFYLTVNGTTYAQYTFGFEGSTPWSTYSGSIIQAAAGTSQNPLFYKRFPRYPIRNGLFQYSSYLVQDYDTVVAMLNNGTGNVGSAFQNPVQFSFNTTSTKDGTVFALVFRVPVYALSGTTGRDGTPAVTWQIRPGWGDFWLDLDDGAGGPGGAVLIGTGDVAGYLPTGGTTWPQ
jgi:hypothetical protein